MSARVLFLGNCFRPTVSTLDIQYPFILLDDVEKPLAERQEAHLKIQEQMMNPKEDKDFNPETFDPMEGVPNYEILKRERIDPPVRLDNQEPH